MNRRQFVKYLMTHKTVENNWIYENEKDIKKIISFIWETFIYTPRILKYVNKYINTYDFNSFKLDEKVNFIHFIINKSNLSTNWLNFEFFPRTNRINRYLLIKDIPDTDKRSFWHLEHEYGLFKTATMDTVSRKPQKLSKQDKEKIETAVRESEEANSCVNTIKELNQEIIDKYELSLFDISILDFRNQIQYVFLDKDNRKVVYRAPYKMSIKYHPNSNLLEKDYFESYDNLYEYTFVNVWDYVKFRKALNGAFLNSLKI